MLAGPASTTIAEPNSRRPERGQDAAWLPRPELPGPMSVRDAGRPFRPRCALAVERNPCQARLCVRRGCQAQAALQRLALGRHASELGGDVAALRDHSVGRPSATIRTGPS